MSSRITSASYFAPSSIRSLSHFCVTGLTSASNFTASTFPLPACADETATSATSNARMRDRFTVVRIPPASLPEQVSSGTVQKGCGSETASACSAFVLRVRRGPRTRRRRCAWSCATSARRRHARSRPRRSGSTWSACTGRDAGRRRSACAGRTAGARGRQADDDWGRSGVWRREQRRVDRARRRDPDPQARRRDARARVPALEPADSRAGPSAADHRLAHDRHALRLACGRGDPPREAALRAVAAVRARAPHGQLRTRTRATSPRRSCAASRSTTCRETAGTTSATTSSSTRAARCSKAATAGS